MRNHQEIALYQRPYLQKPGLHFNKPCSRSSHSQQQLAQKYWHQLTKRSLKLLQEKWNT